MALKAVGNVVQSSTDDYSKRLMSAGLMRVLSFHLGSAKSSKITKKEIIWILGNLAISLFTMNKNVDSIMGE